jgi:DNA-binding MarR family transcriptional regulator
VPNRAAGFDPTTRIGCRGAHTASAPKALSASTTGLVDALVDAGFVGRTPHPTDRGAILGSLTDRPGRVAAEEHLSQAGAAAVAGPARPERAAAAGLHLLHPALPGEAQIALTLRVVCGLTTAEIARAFLVPETTVGPGSPALSSPGSGIRYGMPASAHGASGGRA